MNNIIIDLLRLYFGFMLQVFPYAYLCIASSANESRIRYCKTVTFIFVCIEGIIFSVCSTAIQYNVSDPIQVYRLINMIFMVLFLLCTICYCLVIKAKMAIKIYTICYIATFAFFISLFVTILWESKLCQIFPFEWNNGVVYAISYDIFLFISTLLVFPPFYIVVKKLLMPTARLLKEKEGIYSAYLSAMLLLLLSVGFAILDYSFVKSKMASVFCFTLCIAIVGIYCVFSLLISKTRQAEMLQIDLLNSKYNANIVSQQYKRIKENIENQKRLRHNFRQQLLALRGLCEQPDTDIRKYISEYIKHIPEYTIMPLCNNPIFNSILSYYKETAENENFKFSCSINLPAIIYTSEIDIVTIIGNLLENALNAGMKLPENERRITVNIDFFNKMIGIAIDNTFDGHVIINNDKYCSTTHADPGIGLQSISNIANKYNGNAVFSHKENMFFSSVMLSNITCKE